MSLIKKGIVPNGISASFRQLHSCAGAWTIRQGHDLCEAIELAIIQALPLTNVTTHLEPLEDATSWNDLELERTNKQQLENNL